MIINGDTIRRIGEFLYSPNPYILLIILAIVALIVVCQAPRARY